MNEEKVRNQVRDIPEELLDTILQSNTGSKKSRYDGVTLREYIKVSGVTDDATLAVLYQAMQHDDIKWPFRLLKVTVEVTQTAGYDIPVLDEHEVQMFARGQAHLEDFDPEFNLDEKFDDLITENYYANCDYAVDDDLGRTIVPWDD